MNAGLHLRPRAPAGALPPASGAGEAGFSVVELAVATALGSALLLAVAGVLATQERFARAHAARATLAEAVRTGAIVLPAELRWLEPAEDLRAASAESLAVRAFRGLGIVCRVDGEVAWVRYRGLREPDPEKDSVLVVAGLAAARAIPLAASARAAAACPAGPAESVLRWPLSGAAGPGALALLFESGSYYLTGRALRYRRGAGGRQPLTAESLDAPPSAFRLVGPDGEEAGLDAAVALEVMLAPAPLRFLGAPAADGFATRLRIAFLNRPSAGDAGPAAGAP